MVQKCKRCRKTISSRKTSGYCRHCYRLEMNRKYRNERKAKKLCIICGEKIKPVLVYHTRCDRCEKRSKSYIKTFKDKKKSDTK